MQVSQQQPKEEQLPADKQKPRLQSELTEWVHRENSGQRCSVEYDREAMLERPWVEPKELCWAMMVEGMR